ncbi:MAG: trigger factor [Brevinematia bacterium]
MEIVVRELPDCLREAYAYVNLFEVDNAFQKELEYLQGDIEFPGYRKGKVPFEIIEKNYLSKLNNLVFSALLTLAVDEIEKTKKIESISDVKALKQLKRGEPFSFYISFFEEPALLNEVDLDNQTVEYEEYFYDEKIVKDKILNFLVEYEESDGKVDEEDRVYLGLINDVVDKIEDIEITPKELPVLLGKKKGDNITLSFFELGNGYVSRFLGKTKEPLNFKINRILKPKKLPLTDESVAKKSHFKTVDELKKDVQEFLNSEVNRLNAISKRSALREHVSKNVKVSFNKYDFFRFLSDKFYRFFLDEMGNANSSIGDLIFDKKIRDKFLSLIDEFYKEYVETIALTLLGKKLKIKPDQRYIDYILYERAMKENVGLDEIKQKIPKEELYQIELFAIAQTLLDELEKKVNFKVKNRLPYGV